MPPLDWCLMKSMIAPILLVATALLQSMGLFPYHGDGITLAGQLLFPILFALLAMYLSTKGTPGAFATVHLVILIASVILLILSLVGMNLTIPQLYPTMILYYIVFVLAAVECGLRIAGMPKKRRPTGREELGTSETTV